MRRRGTSKSGNSFCDWLDCASRSSKVSLYYFSKILTFFRRIALHSLVALENQSMLLIGGWDYGNGGAAQSGIWQLKNENWNKIGDLLQV